VEGHLLVGPPGRHAVVEPEEHLLSVVDGPERLELGAFAKRRLHDESAGVGVGDVEALVALPHTGEAPQRSELQGYDRVQGRRLVGHADASSVIGRKLE
jgi:hypothetical protein